jgi:NitT/TauT family transport system permease protein
MQAMSRVVYCPEDECLWGFFMSVLQETNEVERRLSTRIAVGEQIKPEKLAPLFALIIFLVIWHLVSLNYPAFILPSPVLVFEKMIERMRDGTLVVHILTTLSEAVPGLILGTLVAFAIGYPIAKSRVAASVLHPFIVASQGIPFIAVAPLLFIWFGSGLFTKILVCALIVFFPIIINVIAGLHSISPTLRDLFRMMNATPRETFLKLELPASLSFVFAGLRTGGALSMIGALTGEFLSADRGLGFFINQANGLYDTPAVMAGIVVTVAVALAIYGCVRWLEHIAQPSR